MELPAEKAEDVRESSIRIPLVLRYHFLDVIHPIEKGPGVDEVLESVQRKRRIVCQMVLYKVTSPVVCNVKVHLVEAGQGKAGHTHTGPQGCTPAFHIRAGLRQGRRAGWWQ